MPHAVPAPHSRSRTAARRLRRAGVEAGVVFSLTLAILAVIFAGVDRAAAAGLDMAAFGSERLTAGAVLLAIFAGMCVLTTFMMRNTLAPARETRPARKRGRLG